MRNIFVLFLLVILSQSAQCAQFGEYKYSNYNAINAQLQARRMQAIRQQQRYGYSPARNIQYPTSSNPYPNIQRTQGYNLSRNQRYSRDYYNSL